MSAVPAEDDGLPRLVVRGAEDHLLQALRELQLAVLGHPAAAHAAYAALVAEGRRFAATPEGERWSTRLAGSDLLRRVRMVWDASTLEQLAHPDAAPPVTLPSVVLDALVGTAQSPALEKLLTRLVFRRSADRGAG